MGISGGGTITFTTAALDERVKAAVVSGAFCTYRDSIFSRSHCIDNYIPGILRWFETADLTGLIAPRYLFVEAGSQDNIFPRPGVEEALQNARKVYRNAGSARPPRQRLLRRRTSVRRRRGVPRTGQVAMIPK